MGKLLMVMGGILLVLGALLHFGGNILPLFNLPGDIKVQRGNFTFNFPVVSCLLLSVLLSLLFNFWNRR